MEYSTLFTEARRQEAALSWEGTFADYLALVTTDPALARLTHARIYDMIVQAGTHRPAAGESSSTLFAADVFGQDAAIEQLVEHLRAAGRRLEVRKRIFVLLGPPGSGKSTLANALKRGLERYSRSHEGAVYAIAGCPMQEDPLHLIPAHLRPDVEERYGLYIEGDLCPRCRYILRHDYDDSIEAMRIKRVLLSEYQGVGFGTFVATDPGSLEINRLMGSVDTALLSGDRVESTGRAYRLDGELHAANRGIMEFIDIFKLDYRFLSVLEVLAEEQKIKASGFGGVYADEFILAHTNEADYKALIADPKTEALQDRCIIVHVPYTLRLSAEVRIYHKLLRPMHLEGIHLAPLTLPTAAAFAVLSRLQPSRRSGVTLVTKLKLYDQQPVAGCLPQIVPELRREAPREGMDGISPRFVINALSDLVAGMAGGCVTPSALLTKLWSEIEQSSRLGGEERSRLAALFDETRRLYDEMAQWELQRAFVPHFEQAAADLMRRYLDHAARSLRGERADEGLLRGCEDNVRIRDRERGTFRATAHEHSTALAQTGAPPSYGAEPYLALAIAHQVVPEWRQISAFFTGREPDAEGKKAAVVQRLVDEWGYNEECAAALWADGERIAGSGRLPGWPWS